MAGALGSWAGGLEQVISLLGACMIALAVAFVAIYLGALCLVARYRRGAS